MVKPFGIPELVDRIIDHLHDDIPTLRSTALVSKLWTPASHFHVLQRVYVIGEIGATTIFLGTPGTTIFPGGSIQSKLSHTASITFTQLAIDGSTVRNLLTTISHLKRLQSLNLHCCTWFCANEAEANLYLGPSLSLGSLQLSASCLHGHYHVATFLSSFRTIKHLKLLECNSNYTLRASDRPLLRASHRLSLDELSYRCANKLFLPELINILGMRPRNLRLDVSRKYDLSNHAICSLLHDSVQHLSVYIPDDTAHLDRNWARLRLPALRVLHMERTNPPKPFIFDLCRMLNLIDSAPLDYVRYSLRTSASPPEPAADRMVFRYQSAYGSGEQGAPTQLVTVDLVFDREMYSTEIVPLKTFEGSADIRSCRAELLELEVDHEAPF